jgi:hypothetical protein
MASANHPFWEFLSGRSPGPPVFQLLGCEVLEAELGSGFMKGDGHRDGPGSRRDTRLPLPMTPF